MSSLLRESRRHRTNTLCRPDSRGQRTGRGGIEDDADARLIQVKALNA